MPLYDFACNTCKTIQEIRISAEEVNTNPHWNLIVCQECGDQMEQVFDSMPGVIWKGSLPTGAEIKQGHQMRDNVAAMEEGFTSQTEYEEGMGLAAEEEKKRGMRPGTLTTGIEKPITDEAKKASKEHNKTMLAAAKAARKRSLK